MHSTSYHYACIGLGVMRMQLSGHKPETLLLSCVATQIECFMQYMVIELKYDAHL